MIDYSPLEFMYNWEQKRLPLTFIDTWRRKNDIICPEQFSLRNALTYIQKLPELLLAKTYLLIDFPCYGISLRWILGNCGHPHYLKKN